MSTTGFRLISALVLKEMGGEEDSIMENEEIVKCLDRIMDYKFLYSGAQDLLEDEILYGSAGYLYCLLMMKKHFAEYKHD